MTVALEQFAAELAVTPQELERRSLLAYIERERRLIALDIADLQDRYDVHTHQELSKRIEQRRVYSHPAWEDLIEWERLSAYLTQIQDWELQLESDNV